MKHFYQNIDGWFNFQNLYEEMVMNARDGDHFVEVGSWKGCSSAFMAVTIINSNKKIRFDCIDTWEGSDEQAHTSDKDVISGNLYDVFIRNMNPVEGYYSPFRMSSLDAIDLYDDRSLDFVYIDAAHDYESVKADILAWYPKVKLGGVLAGHDFPMPGVNKAVTELLSNYGCITDNVSWMVRKTLIDLTNG